MSGNTEVVEGAYGAFARGDIASVIDAVDEQVSWDVPESVPHGGSFRGKEGVGEFFQGLGGKWEGLELEIEDLIDGGDNVIGVGRASGRLKDGDTASYGFAHVFTIGDGRIVRFREYVDLDERLRA
jgi:ketosteroid isomerase-like protein